MSEADAVPRDHSHSERPHLGLSLGLAKQGALIALGLFTWVKSWQEIFKNTIAILNGVGDQKFDVKFTGPLLVLLVGLVATNAIGFFYFYRKEQFRLALAALLDLDGLYLVVLHGANILRAESVTEWDAYLLRNAVWRSLPLACVELFLVVRGFMEIPICQGTLAPDLALTGITHVVLYQTLPGVAENALKKFEIWGDVSRVDFLLNGKGRNDSKLLAGLLSQQSIINLQTIAAGFWTACHCSQSQWSLQQKSLLADDAETCFPNFIPDRKDSTEPRGQLGTGNLATINLLTAAEIREKLSNDERLAYHASRLLSKTKRWFSRLATAAVHVVPQRYFVDLIFGKIRQDSVGSKKDQLVYGIKQTRPHLKWTFLTALILMLNASRPVSAAACKIRKVSALKGQVAVILHGSLDTLLAVSTLILASTAHPALSLEPSCSRSQGTCME